jgi:hypothetical protein
MELKPWRESSLTFPWIYTYTWTLLIISHRGIDQRAGKIGEGAWRAEMHGWNVEIN